MDIKKKLQNPFVLVAQGFAVGSLLFWSNAPAEADAPVAPPVQAAALETLDAA